MQKMIIEKGTLDFHSHPHNDDLIPSKADRDLMRKLRKLTGQRSSTIVTPNGRTSMFNEHGIVDTGQVSNALDDNHKKALIQLFGGKIK